MKTCPYCAEEIKDAAIKCRWCGSWLVDEVPAGAVGPSERVEAKAELAQASERTSEEPRAEVEPVPEPATSSEPGPEPAPAAATASETETAPLAQPPVAEAKIEFTHTGSQYLLGYAPDHFGIWDRNSPQQPVETFPRDDDGWAAAWARYSVIEQNWMDLRTGQKSA